MEFEFKSEGKCLFCGELISQRTISRHLSSHLTEIEKKSIGSNTKRYVHIVVDSAEMFLQLLVSETSKMKIIDQFLRDIWLECCDHLSGFEHKDFKVSKNEFVGNVFEPKRKFTYHYDWGDTTSLNLKGLKRYNLNFKENIILLSRNEPLEILCATCKTEPAEFICTSCNWEKYSYFCDKCADEHEKECPDFEDYAKSPVVNSPRMGTCGYTGGSIDLERDGIFKNKN